MHHISSLALSVREIGPSYFTVFTVVPSSGDYTPRVSSLIQVTMWSKIPTFVYTNQDKVAGGLSLTEFLSHWRVYAPRKYS